MDGIIPIPYPSTLYALSRWIILGLYHNNTTMKKSKVNMMIEKTIIWWYKVQTTIPVFFLDTEGNERSQAAHTGLQIWVKKIWCERVLQRENGDDGFGDDQVPWITWSI